MTHRHAYGFAALVLIAPLATPASAADPPVFDAHVHYSHDAVEVLPPADAVGLLRKAGLRRALVSSSGDEGTHKLAALAPELILPSLRPYRTRADVSTWVRDPTLLPWLEERLAKARYVAIGEFHVYGADADLPNVRRVVDLANKHKLVLHAHSDADAIDRLFRHDPQARVLWAHSGFAAPDEVRAMLRKHRNLWCDLAFRSEHGSGGKVDAAWRAVFVEFPDRFMVGTDTYTPERWHYVVEHANWTRAWLSDLPRDLAERLAWRNGEALFAAAPARSR